jgi:hypothetical protein
VADWRERARKYAKQFGLNPDVFERQINAESGFNPNARSPAGATGIAQIMPGTAKGWGVDPNDPDAALRASAKNMASYVKKYGGIENALRAYNAGPGAIEASRGYGETNAYVKKILQGASGSGGLSKPSGGGGGVPTSSGDGAGSSYDRLIETFERLNAATPQSNTQLGQPMGLQAYGFRNQNQSSLADTIKRLAELRGEDEPSGGGGGGGDVEMPSGGGKAKGLAELFYDPMGGWDSGKQIGAIGGHSDHVHIGGQPETVLSLAKAAEKMGLAVRENKKFDPVDPVHTKGSWHYRFGGTGGADISGDPKKMAAFTKYVLRRTGWKK